ncbi:MAG: hypothetical protein CVV60_00745 [Tenericutes bacterium HGW-Tenericutes-5]|jgi:DNA repair photolyase|nr:MAG: hypothetical protein CVV60_00745 [Tenericutes bacterium HGW-Tenericutes-5]
MNSFKVVIINKNRTKFFGVDYFANVYDGSKESFKYFASSIDPLMNYQNEIVKFNEMKYQLFRNALFDIEPGKIIGFFQNPDIYQDLETIDFILKDLQFRTLGLFIETNSEKILNDLDALKEFSKKLPLIIAIPVHSYSNIDMSFFDKTCNMEAMTKLIHKLKDAGLNVGVIFKPLIPKINDETMELEKIIEKCDSLNVDFIYPSFTVYFDSFKLKNFYDIIETEKPELRNFMFDKFGQKNSWESDNLAELKKILVFNSKKSKIKYAMKDIIDIYRDDAFTQLKLF